jgi:NAD(P)-dependent dehydrogenase (short-subunit alcohol dehydrogenase family)
MRLPTRAGARSESDFNMEGPQILITGATNGVGLAAAEALAARGASLLIVGRSQTRTRVAEARIRGAARGAASVASLVADLASPAEVRRLAREVLTRFPEIRVLINNAGAMFTTRQLAADRIERTWALNHLAPFLLTNLLLDRLKANAPARIVTTASEAHRGARIPFDDLNAERSYRGFSRYGESKLANILFTRELARRLAGCGVTANCFHPGLVATGFNRNNGLLMNVGMVILKVVSRTPAQGADTLVWLATSAEAEPVNGGYFIDRQQRAPSMEAQDAAGAQRLWELSETQCAGVLAVETQPKN